MKATVGSAERGALVLEICEARGIGVTVKLDPGGTEDVTALPEDARAELSGDVFGVNAEWLDEEMVQGARLGVVPAPCAHEKCQEHHMEIVACATDAARLRLLLHRDRTVDVVTASPGSTVPPQVSPVVRLLVDMEERTVELAEPGTESPARLQVMDRFRTHLDDDDAWGWLVSLWEHVHEEMHDHGHDHGGEPEDDLDEPGDWRDRDWSWWQPGSLVPYEDVTDEFEAAIEHESAYYDVIDLYCVTPGCPCRSMTAVFNEAASGKEVGAVTFDMRADEVEEVEATGDRRALVLELWGAFRKRIGIRTLRERHREMHAHGPEIARLAGQAVETPGPKVGPNEPCPCGSGRKHKHCCM